MADLDAQGQIKGQTTIEDVLALPVVSVDLGLWAKVTYAEGREHFSQNYMPDAEVFVL